MTNTLKLLLASLLFLILTACTGSQHTESAGEYIDSSTTTTKVKASLVDELGTSGLFVKVKTYKDEVQLSGFVDTQRIKQRAGIVAAGVDGVRNVRNDIIIKSR
jgi:osmotically-inducible protein OsmY